VFELPYNMEDVKALQTRVTELTEENRQLTHKYNLLEKEVVLLERQLQRNANNILILSQRLRDNNIEYRIVVDEKAKLG
jgi:uncharacterized protein YhaN